MTFFAKRTLLNILTRYCVLDAERKLLVVHTYQIVAAERILQLIATNSWAYWLLAVTFSTLLVVVKC